MAEKILKEMLEAVESYEDNTLEDNIRKRLELNLSTYLKDLSKSYYSLKENANIKMVIKELSK